MRKLLIILCISLGYYLNAQETVLPSTTLSNRTVQVNQESPFKTGYYPLGFFDVDLRYLIKYNDYEGIRLGLGGITNDKLFENLRFGGYLAGGIKDRELKYSIGGSLKVSEEGSTWVSFYYTDDIREIGAHDFLTDARIYSLFEPRLINIRQFFHHETWQVNIQHELSKHVFSELRLSLKSIDQIENYFFIEEDRIYKNYELAEINASFRFNPTTKYHIYNDDNKEPYYEIPQISAQITQGIKGILNSDFSYTKLAVKVDYQIKRQNRSLTQILLEGDLAMGNTPLTHLFHAYPNGPNKDEILQRFSVAGRSSFETMFFGEFFSDRLVTLQFKHGFPRFNISARFRPELVLISRHAIGDMQNPKDHIGIPFEIMNNIFSEAGLEINNLVLGFGLSFAYRYGFYHKDHLADNISFKFTFYPKI